MKLGKLVFAAIAASGASQAFGQVTLSTLATFNGFNGAEPIGGLVFDSAGNLYGAANGGSAYGTVYEVGAATRALTTLANFNSNGGMYPWGNLVCDVAGDLYGMTQSDSVNSAGTIYEVAANTGSITTLVTFNGANGTAPRAGMISDAAGNLYGTTSGGGLGGYGTVFEVTANTHMLSTLFSFNRNNGSGPFCGLTFDSAGNLYGTTSVGGTNGYGSVFELAAGTHAFTSLFSFNGTDGQGARGSLACDAAGNLYGTTDNGGTYSDGTVFEIVTGTHALSTLVSFNGTDGSLPLGGLILDAGGNLFGTTDYGGANNDGTVFEITATGHSLSTLVTFNINNGEQPYDSLISDTAGNLYGTTCLGGDLSLGLGQGAGTVFEVSGTDFVVVPEPGSLGVLGVAAIGLLGRRRQPGR